jgi:argininosuccinate synthase
VTGTVRLKLFKGSVQVVGRKAVRSLYDFDLATYADDDRFDHDSAVGFISIWGLPTRVFARVNGGLTERVPEQLVSRGAGSGE